ncbi:hypothetical protein LA080_014638 [Diaporthe eres]|nr:hypothetical protein LA080_014638 [Diaporthe eres]
MELVKRFCLRKTGIGTLWLQPLSHVFAFSVSQAILTQPTGPSLLPALHLDLESLCAIIKDAKSLKAGLVERLCKRGVVGKIQYYAQLGAFDLERNIFSKQFNVALNIGAARDAVPEGQTFYNEKDHCVTNLRCVGGGSFHSWKFRPLLPDMDKFPPAVWQTGVQKHAGVIPSKLWTWTEET